MSQIKAFEKLETDEERIQSGKQTYDQFIMKELLSQSHVRYGILEKINPNMNRIKASQHYLSTLTVDLFCLNFASTVLC